MKCNFKTMLSTGAVLLAAAGIAYLSFESARPAILSSLPFIAILLCPISMLFMMMAMGSTPTNEPSAASKIAEPSSAGQQFQSAKSST